MILKLHESLPEGVVQSRNFYNYNMFEAISYLPVLSVTIVIIHKCKITYIFKLIE